LLNEEIRRPDIHGEQLVEILDRQSLDRRGLGDAGFGERQCAGAPDAARGPELSAVFPESACMT
jgi:hypothetical protein